MLRIRHVAVKLATLSFGFLFVSDPVRALRVRTEQRHPRPGTPLRVVLCCHIYYPEIFSEVLDCFDRMPSDSRLIVTVPPERMALLREQAEGRSDIHVHPHPNRGRDIAPFLTLLASGAFDHADLILKLHTKRSGHLRDGDTRRRLLFHALAGSRCRVQRVLDLFAAPRTGLVGWRLSWRNDPLYWFDNRDMVAELLGRLRVAPSSAPHFFEGSMFWVRRAALEPIKALDLTTADFPPEAGQLDGALQHAVERIFVETAAAVGYDTLSTSGRLLHSGGPTAQVGPAGDRTD